MKAISALFVVSFTLIGSCFALDSAPVSPTAPEEQKAEEPKPAQLKNPNWEPVAIGGIEYVSGVSIARFYKFDPPVFEGDKVTLDNKKVRMEFSIGSDEILLNGVKFKLTTQVRLHEGESMVSRMDLSKLLDPVLRPDLIAGENRTVRTVVIDPVFGGDQAGQKNARGTEAGFAFQIANKLKDQLKGKGVSVELTRGENENPSLAERTERVRKLGPNVILISLGFNSDAAARGVRTLVMAPIGVPGIEGPLEERDEFAVTGNAHENLSIALATASHSCVLRKLGKNGSDLGIARSRNSLLKQLDSPAIIVECGLMAHPEDSRLIPDEGYQNAVARGLAEAVGRYQFAVRS